MVLKVRRISGIARRSIWEWPTLEGWAWVTIAVSIVVFCVAAGAKSW